MLVLSHSELRNTFVSPPCNQQTKSDGLSREIIDHTLCTVMKIAVLFQQGLSNQSSPETLLLLSAADLPECL